MCALRLLIVPALAALLVAGCGDDDGAIGTIDGSMTTVTAQELATTEASTAEPESSTTAVATPTTIPPPTTGTPPTVAPAPGSGDGSALPGEPFDSQAPAGAVLGVVGVAHDDVLNVREYPGMTAIIARLAPTADDVVSAGEGRLLSTSVWWKVTADGRTGWVNSRFVAYLSGVDDLTAAVVSSHGGYPTAANMELLGWTVAEALASDDPPSMIVMSVAPTSGDLGEVTYDVIGLGDDAHAGWRLHVFGAPEGGGFSLKSVEATVLCARGLHGEACV